MVTALADAASLHHSVESVRVADFNIAPCCGCNACFSSVNNRCAQDDDMRLLYEKLARTDILVLASPVYFYGVSAQLAAAVQRLHNPLRDAFHISKAALLLAAASRKPHVCESILLQYSLLLKNFDIQDAGHVFAQGVKDLGDVMATPFLAMAADLGAGL